MCIQTGFLRFCRELPVPAAASSSSRVNPPLLSSPPTRQWRLHPVSRGSLSGHFPQLDSKKKQVVAGQVSVTPVCALTAVFNCLPLISSTADEPKSHPQTLTSLLSRPLFSPPCPSRACLHAMVIKTGEAQRTPVCDPKLTTSLVAPWTCRSRHGLSDDANVLICYTGGTIGEYSLVAISAWRVAIEHRPFRYAQ